MSIKNFVTVLQAESTLSDRSIRAYTNDLVQYESWLTARRRKLDRDSARDVQSYLDHLEESGRRPTSIRRSVSAIAKYHKICGRPLNKNEVQRPKVNAKTKAFGRALSAAQIEGIRTALHGDRSADLRNQAALELLYGLGLRVSELVALDLADVSLPKRVIRPLGKQGAHRVVPLGGSAEVAVQAWLKTGRKAYARERGFDPHASSAVFVNRDGERITRQAVSRTIARAARNSNMSGTIAPHMIRDTCARHMMAGGALHSDVDSLLGHIASVGSPRVTWEEVRRLRDVLETSHPAWG